MTRPSWQDFGTHDESAYPQLWDGVVGAWCPSLGPTGAVLIQTGSIIRPRGRYVAPLVDNNSGQATRNQTTASNNLSRVYLVPRRLVVND